MHGLTIAQEEIGRVGRVAADLEDLEQVVELPVDVAADGDRTLDVHDIRL